MALLLTTNTEDKLAITLLVRRSIGNAKRVSQWCVGRPEELRSEDQITRKNASAPWCDHLIRAMEGGVTHWPRPRTDNRDRGYLLTKVFASEDKHCYDTRHDKPGIARAPRTRGQWRLSMWKLSRARGDASVVRPGPVRSTSNPGSNSEVSEHDYPNRKVFIPRPDRGRKWDIPMGPPSVTRRHWWLYTCIGHVLTVDLFIYSSTAESEKHNQEKLAVAWIWPWRPSEAWPTAYNWA